MEKKKEKEKSHASHVNHESNGSHVCNMVSASITLDLHALIELANSLYLEVLSFPSTCKP